MRRSKMQTEVSQQPSLTFGSGSGESEFLARSAVLKTRERIAAATNSFYNSLIDSLLTAENLENFATTAKQLVEELPKPMQQLYGRGVDRLYTGLQRNHNLIVSNRGDEVNYLLSVWMNAYQVSQEAQKVILQRAETQAVFREPSPGIPILEINRELWELIKITVPDISEADAVTSLSCRPDLPSLILLPKPDFGELTEKSSIQPGNLILRHEIHHLIWGLLGSKQDSEQDYSYSRKVNSSMSEKFQQAFGFFRSEIIGYLLAGSHFSWLSDLDPEQLFVLVYTRDNEVLKVTAEATNFLIFCIKFSQKSGIDQQHFLYAAMSARDFEDIKNRFAQLVPLDDVDSGSVESIYNFFAEALSTKNYSGFSRQVFAANCAEILKIRNCVVAPEALQAYVHQRVMSPEVAAVHEVFGLLANLENFAGLLGIPIDRKYWSEIAEQTIRQRLSQLPKTTVNVVLELAQSNLSLPWYQNWYQKIMRVIGTKNTNNRAQARSPEPCFFKLDVPPVVFLRHLFVPHIIKQQFQLYRKIVNSSPIMRQALSTVLPEVLQVIQRDIENASGTLPFDEADCAWQKARAQELTKLWKQL